LPLDWSWICRHLEYLKTSPRSDTENDIPRDREIAKLKVTPRNDPFSLHSLLGHLLPLPVCSAHPIVSDLEDTVRMQSVVYKDRYR
jgi:hypothetical protein